MPIGLAGFLLGAAIALLVAARPDRISLRLYRQGDAFLERRNPEGEDQ